MLITEISLNIEQCDADLLGNLARAYRLGRGVNKNLDLSAKLMTAAYQKKSSWGNELFDILWDLNTPESEELMIQSAKNLAERGDGDAIGHLGKAHYFGKGVEKNNALAVKYMREAANKNITWAKKRLFDILWAIDTPESRKELLEITTKTLSTSSDSKYNMGRICEEGKGLPRNYNEAAKWYRKSASEGNKSAKNALFDLLLKNNTADSKNEASLLLSEFEKSNQGNSLARVARAYRDGKICVKDLKKSAEYYNLAIQNGLKWAKSELFDLLISMGEKHHNEAFLLAQEGTADQNAQLIGRLARCYLNGWGCEKSLEKALNNYYGAYNLESNWKFELFDVLWLSEDDSHRSSAIQLLESDSALATESNLTKVFYHFLSEKIDLSSTDILISVSKESINGLIPKSLDKYFEKYSETIHIVFGMIKSVKKTVIADTKCSQYAMTSSSKFTTINMSGDVCAIPVCRSHLCCLEIYPEKGIKQYNLVSNKFEPIIPTITTFADINPIVWRENRRLLGFYDYYWKHINLLNKTPAFRPSYIDYKAKLKDDNESYYNFVMCSDKNLVEMIAVVLYSIHLNLKIPCSVWILQSDYSENQKNHLEAYGILLGIEVNIVNVDAQKFAALFSNRYLPKAAFYYVLAHEYIPESITRALYLDPDTLVLKDISKFYNIDFEGSYICACNEFSQTFENGHNAPFNYMFFNSGVVLLNLEKMRRDKINTETISKPYIDQKINVDYADQRLLNYLYWNKSKIVPRRNYNAFPVDLGVYISDLFNPCEEMCETDSYPIDLSEFASIVHFAGGDSFKPWDLPCIQTENDAVYYEDSVNPMQNPFVKLWWEYSNNLPQTFKEKLSRRPKKISRMENIESFVKFVKTHKLDTNNWMYGYVIDYLKTNSRYHEIEVIESLQTKKQA